jgi:putative tryptophan/tyrosine transport system substrate-binding protein
MMDRRTVLWRLTLSALSVPLTAEGQQPGRVARIGFLSPGQAPVEQFYRALQEFGYVQGQNIVLEVRTAAGKVERLPSFADELVRLKVDVIVAVGDEAIRAGKSATQAIPIVMRFATDDPVLNGFVVSYARPGGNITGLTLLAPALEAKRLELLRGVVQGLTHVAVLVHPARVTFQLKDIREAARSLGIQLQIVEASEASQYAAAFSVMTKQRAGALVVMSHPLFFSHHKLLIDLAARSRLPAIYHWVESAEAGGLLAYGANFVELNRRAVGYIDRILKGARPADLPVEGPSAFEFVINLKTAKVLGLSLPQSLVQRADRVIQ